MPTNEKRFWRFNTFSKRKGMATITCHGHSFSTALKEAKLLAKKHGLVVVLESSNYKKEESHALSDGIEKLNKYERAQRKKRVTKLIRKKFFLPLDGEVTKESLAMLFDKDDKAEELRF